MLAAGVALVVPYCAAFADASDDLNKLEMKFFQHNYPKDTQTQRIERIEKLVFGDAQTGPEQSRLAKLIQTVPADNAVADGGNDNSSSSAPVSTASNAPEKPRKTAAKPSAPSPVDAPEPRQNVSGTKYPAVTAIEQRILHQAYESQPIEDRLARLETKMFGKPSNNVDLIDRVDRLKETTKIDVAASPPGGSDWSDEDDPLMSSGMPSAPAPRTSRGGGSYGGNSGSTLGSASGEDGMSFSGRNLREDMKKAFGGMGGGGSYGMGSSSMGGSWGTSSSGSYGMGGGGTAGGGRASAPAPRQIASNVPSAVPSAASRPLQVSGLGLVQQVSLLEAQVFGKAYPNEKLPTRLSRLESNVFPDDKAASEKPLPERVSRLVAEVKSAPQPVQTAPKVAQKSKDKDFDFGDDDSLNIPSTAPQRKSLSNIMNQIGNMMNNANFVGGYSMPSGTLATDPSTGLLIDRTNGNLIDPSTGMVVGRRVAPSPYVTPPVYNAAPMYGGGMVMPPFNNGFAPLGGGSINYGTRSNAAGQRGLGMWP